MEPVRTCVGCKKPDSRANLLRFVISSNELIADEKRVLPGRGAWVHPQCSQLAQDRGAFARALKKRQK